MISSTHRLTAALTLRIKVIDLSQSSRTSRINLITAATKIGRAFVAMADDYASRVAVMRPVSKLMTKEPPWSSMAAPIASNKRSLTAESRATWSLRD